MGLIQIQRKLISLQKNIKPKTIWKGITKPDLTEERATNIIRIIYSLSPPNDKYGAIRTVLGDKLTQEVIDSSICTDG